MRARSVRDLLSLLFCKNEEVIADVRDRLESTSGSLQQKLALRLLLARLSDMRRLTLANLGGIVWSAFAEESRSTASDVRALIQSREGEPAGELARIADADYVIPNETEARR